MKESLSGAEKGAASSENIEEVSASLQYILCDPTCRETYANFCTAFNYGESSARGCILLVNIVI